jgi:D-serine deaminase-like pyridoxal phosphate-dependent protein
VAMFCPVVAKHHDRNEMVVYGGGIHFSKDFILLKNGERCYGKLIQIQEKSWLRMPEFSYLKSLSQEHGIVKCAPGILDRYNVGEIAGFLPVHSCMTANLMGGYTDLQGNTLHTFF